MTHMTKVNILTKQDLQSLSVHLRQSDVFGSKILELIQHVTRAFDVSSSIKMLLNWRETEPMNFLCLLWNVNL